MSSRENSMGAISWKINLERCPEEIHHMLSKYLKELIDLLESHPTENLELMRYGDKALAMIPNLIQEIEILRLKMSEVDGILESGQHMLTGYYQHMTTEASEVAATEVQELQEALEELENESNTTNPEEAVDQTRQL